MNVLLIYLFSYLIHAYLTLKGQLAFLSPRVSLMYNDCNVNNFELVL